MDSYIEEFVKHLEEYEIQQKKLPLNKRNILPTGTDAQMAMNCMIECFLGEGWYVTYSCGSAQINTEACFSILEKHSRKFRKLMKQASKKLKE